VAISFYVVGGVAAVAGAGWLGTWALRAKWLRPREASPTQSFYKD